MSIMVHSDTGPSYILHEPKPGNGPAVCANCVHVCKGRMSAPEYCEAWTCGAAPVEIRRRAGVDPISGEHVPAWTVGTRCTAKNKTGECPDFQSRRNGGAGDRGGNVDGGPWRGTGSDRGEPVSPETMAFVFFVVVAFGSMVAAFMGWLG